ncbi:MAG: serine hydrolase [Myxococcota bacterium]
MSRALLASGRSGLAPAVLVLLIGCGCREKVDFTDPIPVDDTFERVPATGEELARYEDAAAYSEAHRGLAFMVIRGDTVVFETGQNGHALSEPHHLFSGTKSFTCALFEAAREDGFITPDERVRDTLPELDEAAAALTPDDLLHLTSGMRQPLRLTLDMLGVSQSIEDKYAYSVDLRWNTAPGEVFDYGPAHFNVFGELVTRKIGGDPLAYLEQRVLDPIGLRRAGWIRDPAGNPMLSAGAFTTANEWAKYGVLVRDDGEFLGQRVLPEGALSGCMQGSVANPAYGRTWWLNREVDDDVALVGGSRLEEEGPILWNDGPDDLVVAAGHDDQRLYVIPSEDLVIVRLADGGRGFHDADLLEKALGARSR